MSTQEQPASKFDKKSRVKITEDSKAHKAGDAGKVVESFKTGNYYKYTYHILFDDNRREYSVPENILAAE